MRFIYSNDNIPEAIVKVLLDNKKAKKLEGRLHQGDIQRKIEQIFGHKVGYRRLRKNLTTMKDQKLLNEYDLNEGKRGYKVYYSLTEEAEKMYAIRILGSNKTVERHKNLYQLLIFFTIFKTRNPITERQLYNLIRQLGLTTEKLEKVEKLSSPSPFTNSGLIKDISHFKPLKGVQITRIHWDRGVSDKDPKGAFYHISIPGFTVEEFTSYLHKLRKGKEPRPFSSYSGITNVPFVLDVNYSESEVADAIRAFMSDGTIKPISEVFPEEIRYDLADESIINFVKDVWRVHEYDHRLLFERLYYCGRPKEEDISYLRLLYGKRIADRILSHAHHIRKMNKNHKDRKEEERIQKFIQILGNDRRVLIKRIKERHENTIKDHEIVSSLIEGISFSPFIHRLDQESDF